MDDLRLRLLGKLRDLGPRSVDALADELRAHWPAVYHELERMIVHRLAEPVDDHSDRYKITALGLRSLEVLAAVKAGPPGWKQGELW